MRSKLQEQLLKAGLANQQQAKVINKSKQKQPAQSADKQDVQAQKAAQAERDRQLNEQRKQAAERKERFAQIRQIVTQHALPAQSKTDIAYHFALQGKVKKMYVNQETLSKLERGQLAIVELSNRYHLLSPETADKIRERDAGFPIHQQSTQASRADNADDPYADYQIPDDLMW